MAVVDIGAEAAAVDVAAEAAAAPLSVFLPAAMFVRPTIEAAEEGGGDRCGSLEIPALMLQMCGSDLAEGYGECIFLAEG